MSRVYYGITNYLNLIITRNLHFYLSLSVLLTIFIYLFIYFLRNSDSVRPVAENRVGRQPLDADNVFYY